MPRVTGVGGHQRKAHLVPSRRLIPAIALAVLVVSVAPASANPARPAPVVPTPTTAAPTPPAPQSLAGAIAQAQQLELRMIANGKRADVLDGRYQLARAAVRATAKKVAVTKRKIARTEAAADRLRRELSGRAARLYMGAGSQDPIGMDVSSVQELGSRAKYGEAAAAQDLRVVHDLERAEAKLDSQRKDLQGQLASAKDRQHAVHAARREVERVNAAMRRLLATTNDEIKLLAAKMEADSAAAAAVAERAWLLRQAARARRGGKGPADPGSFGDLPVPGIGAWKAVEYAREQLGKPYVYAGAGPDVFDCSGLTMMAWRQSGVSMEHGSQSQYNSFPHVPIDQLEPGDLVFFGNTGPTNHHVGMVVGPGLMIDAPHTGAFVELVSYFRSDLVPLGARP